MRMNENLAYNKEENYTNVKAIKYIGILKSDTNGKCISKTQILLEAAKE